jgi:hypothetical protein
MREQLRPGHCEVCDAFALDLAVRRWDVAVAGLPPWWRWLCAACRQAWKETHEALGNEVPGA